MILVTPPSPDRPSLAGRPVQLGIDAGLSGICPRPWYPQPWSRSALLLRVLPSGQPSCSPLWSWRLLTRIKCELWEEKSDFQKCQNEQFYLPPTISSCRPWHSSVDAGTHCTGEGIGCSFDTIEQQIGSTLIETWFHDFWFHRGVSRGRLI